MEALLQAASDRTQEDPDFDGPSDLDFSAEQEKVMHAAYEVFEKEVSGMGHGRKMYAHAAFYASLLSNLRLSAEAAPHM